MLYSFVKEAVVEKDAFNAEEYLTCFATLGFQAFRLNGCEDLR